MKAPVIAMMLSLSLCAPALAATFVYVSNADDGNITTYTLQPDGTLKAGDKLVVPDVPPAPQPFTGQFIQLNVTDVVEVK